MRSSVKDILSRWGFNIAPLFLDEEVKNFKIDSEFLVAFPGEDTAKNIVAFAQTLYRLEKLPGMPLEDVLRALPLKHIAREFYELLPLIEVADSESSVSGGSPADVVEDAILNVLRDRKEEVEHFLTARTPIRFDGPDILVEADHYLVSLETERLFKALFNEVAPGVFLVPSGSLLNAAGEPLPPFADICVESAPLLVTDDSQVLSTFSVLVRERPFLEALETARLLENDGKH